MVVRHIVEFELLATDVVQRRNDAAAMHELISALVGVIPGLLAAEVGADLGVVDGHLDVVLISEHESREALKRYQSHPAHLDAAEFIRSVTTSARHTVDYQR